MHLVVGNERSKTALRIGLRILTWGAFSLIPTSTVYSQSTSLIGGNQVLRMQLQQKKMAAEERQKKMESDAARLVEMAQQLKVSVDKTNKDTLSVNVIKEAERIEKLAREVREGMRQ